MWQLHIRRSLAIAILSVLGQGFHSAEGSTVPELQVNLAWDANPEPDIEGYRIHYGTGSGIYAEALDVGNVTTSPLMVPEPGTYFAVVTAYNSAGLESLPSNEITISLPVSPPDETRPVIIGIPADIVTAPDSPAGSTAAVSWDEPTASDDVGVVSFVSTREPGDTFQAGTTTVVYSATDAAGNLASASFTVTVSSIELWRPSVFGSEVYDADISGDQANPDGDAWNNLAEYVHGFNPLGTDTRVATSMSIESDEVRFHLSHIRFLPDVTLIVESLSPPDSDWTSLATLPPSGQWLINPSDLQVSSVPVGDLVEVTLARPIQDKQGEFFRLKMVKVEPP